MHNAGQSERVWKYLSKQEASESDWPLRDDLRIAALCVLEADRGNPDPWLWAFWLYMGIPHHKYIGIFVEREAYKKLLGPTLTEQLQDPLFLATLEASARPFYSRSQMRIDFSRTAEDQAIADAPAAATIIPKALPKPVRRKRAA